VLVNLAKPEEAIEKYKKAFEANPISLQPKARWGGECFPKGDVTGANDQNARPPPINQRSNGLSYGWATALGPNGRNEEATAKYEWATSINPNYVWGIIDQANLSFDRRDVQGGNDLYRQAVKIAPNAEGIYLKWGNALFGVRRYHDAIDKYKKAIEINRDFARAYSSWGDALTAQGAYRAAITKYLKAVRLDPFLADARNGWASALSKLQGG